MEDMLFVSYIGMIIGKRTVHSRFNELKESAKGRRLMLLFNSRDQMKFDLS